MERMNEEMDSSRPVTGMRLSTALDSANFKVEVPSISENLNLSQSIYDRNGNRLLQLFLKAIYKVIFRIRAEKRIKILKEYLAGAPNVTLSASTEQKAEIRKYPIVSTYSPKIIRQRSVIPTFKNVIYPVIAPPLPDLIKPRPIALLEPTYAEKQGFTKLAIPDYDNTFDIKVPRLQFECTAKNEPVSKMEGDNEPTIPEIEISTYAKVDLYVGKHSRSPLVLFLITLFASRILSPGLLMFLFLTSTTGTKRPLVISFAHVPQSTLNHIQAFLIWKRISRDQHRKWACR